MIKVSIALLLCLVVALKARAAESDRRQYVDWSGPTVNAYMAYDTGLLRNLRSDAQRVADAQDRNSSIDLSRGTGPYSVGLGLGYSRMYGSGLVLGLETDHFFPNTQRAVSVSFESGSARRVVDTLQYTGSVRGRVGYATGRWLFYLTGGFTWTYIQTATEGTGA